MILRYRTSDAARCCEIINACLPQLTDMNAAARDYVRAKNVPASLHTDLERLFTVVSVEDGAVMGLGALAGSEIKRVYVDPPCQNRGIGRSIMAALESEAVRRGLNAVHVRSRPNAVPFYCALGYDVRTRETFVIGQSRFAIVSMEKSLGANPIQLGENK